MIRDGFVLAGLFAASMLYPFVEEAVARDHGVMGQSWGIAEPDLLGVIDSRLKGLAADGSIARMQQGLVRKTEASIRNPAPVGGLEATLRPRAWTFDPSIVIADDIRDQKGNLIARAGQRVNPLSFVAMKQDLVFIDGRSAPQIDWAVKRWSQTSAKIIFVAGSPFDAMREKKRRFFYDQRGSLVRHFGIAHVPAVVAPAGQVLRVSEVALPGAIS